MVIVPNLTDNGSARVILPLTGLSGIVPRTRATNIRLRARLFRQRLLNIRERVSSPIARHDLSFIQPLPGGIALVVFNGGLKEIHHILVFDVLRAVAGDVEGREAGRVLAEFMGPEVGVGGALVDPVRVHPVNQVVAPEGLEERVDRGAIVHGHGGAVREGIGRVRRGDWVVLSL